MPFVCTLSNEGFRCEVFKEGGAYSIVMRIGFDEGQHTNYFVQIGLEPMAGGDLEYYFNIIKINGDDGSERLFWSGKDVAQFIRGEDRKLILAAVCSATEALLQHVKPESVYRCTYDEWPPERALEKHHVLSRVFTDCGYKVQMSDPFGCKRVWWAYRE